LGINTPVTDEEFAHEHGMTVAEVRRIEEDSMRCRYMTDAEFDAHMAKIVADYRAALVAEYRARRYRHLLELPAGMLPRA
jgi:hypothetical protein